MPVRGERRHACTCWKTDSNGPRLLRACSGLMSERLLRYVIGARLEPSAPWDDLANCRFYLARSDCGDFIESHSCRLGIQSRRSRQANQTCGFQRYLDAADRLPLASIR